MKRYMPIITALALLAIATSAYGITFSSRTENIGGIQIGDVVVDNQVPIRLRFSAGGLSPAERASLVAQRLSQMSNLSPSEISAGRIGSYWGVIARGEMLITADSAHAAANNTTPSGLASAWASQLRKAMTGAPVATTPPTTPVPTGSGPSEVKTAQKVVPIISVGSGLRVGAALVSGSAEQVAKVTAVAQVEGQFGNKVRLRGLVPIETEKVIGNLKRVPGTAVIAVADLKL
ncbi:MAG: hypothetical protein ABFD64_05675 [Armatimonadota bacterium]